VTSLLKLGEMWDHNGTYMQGFGFQYRDQQVIMQLGPQDNMEGELSSFLDSML